jgi:hypothetical protein
MLTVSMGSLLTILPKTIVLTYTSYSLLLFFPEKKAVPVHGTAFSY